MKSAYRNNVNKLEIVFDDMHIIGINKPPNIAVHKSKVVGNQDVFVLQLLRNQVGYKVYPIHRLDSKTSGVLLFAKSSQDVANFQQLFYTKNIKKDYLAIVRGFFPEKQTLDYGLKTEDGKIQEAITSFSLINKYELPIPFGKHSSSRYSLISCAPLTGRTHQIRRHLAHLNHPIIGDRPHGCNKQNKLFKERWDMYSMLLHAKSVSFIHPITNQKMHIEAKVSGEFKRMLDMLNS